MAKGGEQAVAEHRRLVRRALDGDKASIGELVQLVMPAIQTRITVVLFRGGHHHRGDLEDLMQETLLSLLVSERPALRSWDPELGMPLTGYAALVAERRAISWLRSRRPVPFDPTWLDETSVKLEFDEQVYARSTLLGLAQHLHEVLSPQGLEMFYRLYTWEQSVEQITSETGLGADAVYQWKSRLKKMAMAFVAEREKIRPLLSELHPDLRS